VEWDISKGLAPSCIALNQGVPPPHFKIALAPAPRQSLSASPARS